MAPYCQYTFIIDSYLASSSYSLVAPFFLQSLAWLRSNFVSTLGYLAGDLKQRDTKDRLSQLRSTAWLS